MFSIFKKTRFSLCSSILAFALSCSTILAADGDIRSLKAEIERLCPDLNWRIYMPKGLEADDTNITFLLKTAHDELREKMSIDGTAPQKRNRIHQVLDKAADSFAVDLSGQLRKERGVLADYAAKIKRNKLFKVRLLNLLMRAYFGYDYRRPENRAREVFSNTISRTAMGMGVNTHGVTGATVELTDGATIKGRLKKWEKANDIATECFILLTLEGFGRHIAEELKTQINDMRRLLPTGDLDADTKNKVGRTLDKMLETVDAYIAEPAALPADDVGIAGAPEPPAADAPGGA
ncbi:MAG: hypothetical protein LBL99_02740 [Holosporaceae bacterium]|jgi:hypothetical protein|nr:hypothetical protein [Holosporaceae bacterium]